MIFPKDSTKVPWCFVITQLPLRGRRVILVTRQQSTERATSGLRLTEHAWIVRWKIWCGGVWTAAANTASSPRRTMNCTLRSMFFRAMLSTTKHNCLPYRVFFVSLGSVALERQQGIHRAEQGLFLDEQGTILHLRVVPIEPVPG
jgi:hypothetical protein